MKMYKNSGAPPSFYGLSRRYAYPNLLFFGISNGVYQENCLYTAMGNAEKERTVHLYVEG